MLVRGWVSVAALIGSLLLAQRADAGISYQTGTVQGTVLTTTGVAVPQTSVRATSSSGQIVAPVDPSGAYTLTLPADTYQLDAVYQNNVFASSSVTVTASQTTTASFTFAGGVVQVIITRDGAPIANATVQLTLQAPGCGAAGASCTAGPMPGSCFCTLGGQQYFCDPTRGCQWMTFSPYWGHTDATGTASVLVPAGNYTVTGFALDEQNQYGLLQLGQFPATAVDQTSVVAGEFDYTTGVIGGTVTIGGQPTMGAQVRAVSTTGAGEIDEMVDMSGAYSLRLPSGSYTLTATVNGNTPIGDPVTVTITAGSSQQLSFNKPGGYIIGKVTQDGAPVPFARVGIVLQAPGCGATGASCNAGPMPGSCFCTLGGQQYMCDPTRGCQWMTMSPTFVNTDASGNFSQLMPPGAYNVTITSATQWPNAGGITVAQVTASVVDGVVTDLGTTAYQTGDISGQVTSCGSPLQNVGLRVASTSGNGEVDSWPGIMGTTTYDVRVPIGTYNVTAVWQNNTTAGATTLTVTAGASLVFGPELDLGQLRGLILSNGKPAPSSQAMMTLIPPGCGAAGASCTTGPMPGSCFCTLGGQQYMCDPTRGCQYMTMSPIWGYTGTDGFFTVSLPPGNYNVQAFAAEVGNQSGLIAVGNVPATVQACQLSEIGASSTTVAAGSGVPADLGDGVTLSFSSVTGGGSVSYTATSTPQGAPPPSGGISFVGLFYDFIIGASFSGTVQVCLPYDPDTLPPNATLQLYHFTGGQWVDVTTSVDTTNHIVCGATSSFSYFVVGALTDHAPVANAGAPINANADASCAALVHLDGSASTDPDGQSDIASYRWYLGGNLIGSGVTLDVEFGLGSSTVQLVVTDREGESSNASVKVTVIDVTPPTLTLSVSPTVIWPPNGLMVEVTPGYTVADNCDPSPQVGLVSLTADDGAPAGDMQIESDRLHAQVRATRFGTDLSGRTYRLQYRATDKSGNASFATPTVLVPHDQSK